MATSDLSRVVERVRERDQRHAQASMRAEAFGTIREDLQRRAHEGPLRRQIRWWPALAFAVGTGLGVLLALRPWLAAETEPQPQASVAERSIGSADAENASEVPTVEVSSGTLLTDGARDRGCEAVASGPRVVLADGMCTMVAPGVRAQGFGRAVLNRVESGLTVERGQVLFDVSPREEADPVTVHVSHGAIRVIGTRFVVDQGDSGGHVDLLEGAIEFIDRSGVTHPVRAGQRFSWPVPSLPSKKPAPARGKRQPARDVGPLLERVAALRARGAYEQAAAELEEALGTPWPSRTAQALSYELGTILSRHLDDPQRACEHWAKHTGQFPHDRYERQVARARETLECP